MMTSRADGIRSRLTAVRASIPPEVQLIVVTKNFPISDIEILYELGERNFGENRVQELVSKRESLPREISENVTWHYQGQIQSNKVNALNRHADVIHSIDSLKVAAKISAEKRVFLQINLDPALDGSSSEIRGGIAAEEINNYSLALRERFAINFLGVMGVAPHSVESGAEGASSLASTAFKRLHGYSLDAMKISPHSQFISAGMSDDYLEAIAQGATHIRLGSSILGDRAVKA